VSLRQDAEDDMIKDRVTLDYSKQHILATLPLKGKVEEFLSPNMDQATCVLNQQYKKLKGKPDNIKSVQKRFGKLFDRGHIKFLNDLPEDNQSKFINKLVQHWIPWRIMHNPKSKSTPVRLVINPSSKTPTRPDWSGGRSLNDFVAKGRVELALPLYG
jgi:hypothetical protein